VCDSINPVINPIPVLYSRHEHSKVSSETAIHLFSCLALLATAEHVFYGLIIVSGTFFCENLCFCLDLNFRFMQSVETSWILLCHITIRTGIQRQEHETCIPISCVISNGTRVSKPSCCKTVFPKLNSLSTPSPLFLRDQFFWGDITKYGATDTI
jgi:hypothetical protein